MSLLERLQRSLTVVAAADREHVRVGGFDAFIDPLRDAKYFSFAIPEPGTDAAALAGALDGLRAAFAERGRTGRTEFAEALTPGLEAALTAAGWTCSERMPVMTCVPGDLRSPPPVDGLLVEEVGSRASEERVRDFLGTQREGFGEDSPISDAEIVRWRGRAATSFHVAGVLDGAVVGTAHASRVVDGITEIAGVATRPAFRRRGIAGLLTAAVTRAAFAGGADLAWLTAADEAAGRVYTAAGFVMVGMMTGYDAPHAPGPGAD